MRQIESPPGQLVLPPNEHKSVQELHDAIKLVVLPYCVDNLEALKTEATNRGFCVEILETSSDIGRRMREATRIVGVACPRKIAEVTPGLDRQGIAYKAVSLIDDDGCFKNTSRKRRINMAEFLKALDWLQGQECSSLNSPKNG